MSDAAAVLASYVRLSTLVDGSVRVTLDIDPTSRAAAFALFDAPGAAVAVARISNESAVAHDRRQQEKPAERKPLSLASKVALTCKERSFSEFLSRHWPDTWKGGWRLASDSGECASLVVRKLCGVTSRSEITEGSEAARLWRTLEADYLHWQREAA